MQTERLKIERKLCMPVPVSNRPDPDFTTDLTQKQFQVRVNLK